jgi:trans-aconitate 2-methyltransferase
MSITWDAQAYDALPLPHEEWGRGVIDGVTLRGHETLIDAGCGTGRDAAAAAELLTDGRIIGLDASESMRTAFAARFAGRDNVTVHEADLMQTWPVEPGMADAVMSVAAFHWLPDHAAVWQQVARALRPGGKVRIDAGGAGNLTRLLAAVEQVGAADRLPQWHYAGVEETLGHLRDAGLDPIEVRLRDAPAYFGDDETYAKYLADVVLHRLDVDQRQRVAAMMGDRCVDYVRLEVMARKPRQST